MDGCPHTVLLTCRGDLDGVSDVESCEEGGVVAGSEVESGDDRDFGGGRGGGRDGGDGSQ